MSLIWRCRHHHLDLTRRAAVMGVLNVTPDSFSDGGRWLDPDAAIRRGIELADHGAAIIDIGGESTRPGAASVAAEEELRRVLPVIRGLHQHLPDTLLSIDTMKATVADAALDAGAHIINDVSGLTADPHMEAVARSSDCGIIIMHMQGRPGSMQDAPSYHDVVAEVAAFLSQRHEQLVASGIDPQRLVYDPGIGFGKTLAHNLALLRSLPRLAPADRPLLLGFSRKSLIAATTGASSMTDRDWPTVALSAYARQHGVRIVRAHHVRENLHALQMTEAILSADTKAS